MLKLWECFFFHLLCKCRHDIPQLAEWYQLFLKWQKSKDLPKQMTYFSCFTYPLLHNTLVCDSFINYGRAYRSKEEKSRNSIFESVFIYRSNLWVRLSTNLRLFKLEDQCCKYRGSLDVFFVIFSHLPNVICLLKHWKKGNYKSYGKPKIGRLMKIGR